jgi:hypothetical protein
MEFHLAELGECEVKHGGRVSLVVALQFDNCFQT